MRLKSFVSDGAQVEFNEDFNVVSLEKGRISAVRTPSDHIHSTTIYISLLQNPRHSFVGARCRSHVRVRRDRFRKVVLIPQAAPVSSHV